MALECLARSDVLVEKWLSEASSSSLSLFVHSLGAIVFLGPNRRERLIPNGKECTAVTVNKIFVAAKMTALAR